MSEKNYITSSLYFLNNKIYYEDDEDKSILINNKNWHKYLDEYGWTKLPYGWKRRLKGNDANFRYGLLDCGSNGDCLFHCIGEALHDNYEPDGIKKTVEELRELTSTMINQDNFLCILENYKCEEETNFFNGYWEPSKIKTIDELKEEICKPGDSFWGDHILLQLLQEKLEFNVIILNSGNKYFHSENNNLNEYTIHPLACEINKFNKTIILFYEDGLHFQLVGYMRNNKMITCFSRDELPDKLLEIYHTDCFQNNS